MSERRYDAVVVGAGPNGLAAAITIARAGRSVLVLEANEQIGGGLRSGELTLPGFVHDLCSAIHPLAAASPFFDTVPLGEHGVEWIHPTLPLAHPLDGGRAAVLDRSIDATASRLGGDGTGWRRVVGGVAERWPLVAPHVLGPILRPPRHPVAVARFGLPALLSANRLARSLFQSTEARAMFAGLAAHSMLPLTHPATASFGLLLGATGHAVGWPMPRGGSQQIADAMASYLRSLGGEIRTGVRVASMRDVPDARATLFDVTPRQLVSIAGDRLPSRYRARLSRFRYGPGVFKLDLALDGPVPWEAPECASAGTLHLGGTLEEISAAEAAVVRGEHPERPFVLVAQQSLFDATRAPEGKHTLWTYCHVPLGSTVDMTERIEAQIERFAPGFRDRIIARRAHFPADLERGNANEIGGDIAGGSISGMQLAFRPTLSLRPYTTPADGIYLCSASTPPGAGVHGMCGHHAARAALHGPLR